MWYRNASVEPHTIADTAAASMRPNDADRIANEAAAIATIPAASESIPSLRLTRSVEVDQDRRGDQDPGDDREPADARDRALVHARAVGLVVQAADARGDPADDGRREQDDGDGEAEADERRAVLHQSADGLAEGHRRGIAQVGAGGLRC